MLKATGADLKAELKYCRDIIEEHPKNYQVLATLDLLIGLPLKYINPLILPLTL